MATNGDRKTSNGCVVARRVPRSSARCRQPSLSVAAIDFGTTNCSLAYVIGGESSSPELLTFSSGSKRVPTAILFDENGEVTDFGDIARQQYRNLKDKERLRWVYFEQIKMELQKDESVNRKMKVKAQNGKEYYLVEVIAHILKYLKDEFIQVLNESNTSLTALDFNWVITVPAIWRARGKQMMREAGYKAGLCSEDSCTNLKPATHLSEPPKEQHPEKLSLALEPESAAILCQTLPKRQVAPQCKASDPFTASSYLVVDIGGGTVDISAHRVEEGSQTYIHVLHPPTGNDYGGARVNENFKKYLQTLVRDEGFQNFLCTGDETENAANQARLNELINTNFEQQKKLFVNAKSRKELRVLLPDTFLEMYQESIQMLHGSRGVKLVGQDLCIPWDFMATFFEPVRDGILECIANTLEEIDKKGEKIQKIYLVGGFGGCKYISIAIRDRFSNYDCVFPLESAYAVVRGAVLTALRPDMVKCRSVDATYGIGVSIGFEPDLHEPEYRYLDDDGKPRCDNVFLTVVECGDIVGSGEVFTQPIVPSKHNMTSMTLNLYCSLEKDVWYTTGKRKKGSYKTFPAKVHQIGEITIKMPDLTGDKSRHVDITFDFSHTEIQVQGFDRTSSNEITVVLDFLSSSSVHYPNVMIV